MSLEFTPAETEIARIIRTRRTINEFLPEQPPKEIILQGLELARWAPNHKMTEPWRFHDIGPQTVKAIVDLNTELVAQAKGAEAAAKKRAKWSSIPGWLAVTYAKTDDPIRDVENYAAVCCAIQNFMLFLWSEKVGVKWSTGAVLRHEEVYRLLNIDFESRRLAALLWYGYPAVVPTSKRKDVNTFTIVHP